MIFTYKMENETAAALAAARKQIGKLPDQLLSSAVLVVDPKLNSKSIYFSGNKSVIKFSFDIIDYKETKPAATPKKIVYYAIRIDTFIGVMEKAAATKETVEFVIDTDTNKVSIKAGKNRFSTNCYNASELDESSVQDLIDTISGLQNGSEFAKDTCVFKLTPEIINFYESIIGSMSAISKGNAISIEKNKLKYADSLAIVEYTALTDISSTNQIEYLHSMIYDMVKTSIAKVDEFPVTYSSSRQYVHIKNDLIGMEAVICVPDVSFKYPDDADLLTFKPTQKDNLTLTIDKDKLRDAIGVFDGVFDNAIWKLRQIKFRTVGSIASKDSKLEMHWQDFNAEADTDCELDGVATAGKTSENVEFIIPTGQLTKLLNLNSQDSSIRIVCNDLAQDVDNGMGIEVLSDNYKVVIAKLSE